MHDRREFLKLAGFASGGAAIAQLLPQSIARAAAIDPAPGSTFMDAEHVVILMQENRSFDHAFGMLRGVRGFNDPRAMELPSGLPVWVQTNDAGKSYVPFRFDMLESNSTWMGCLPHSWADQVDARNGGRHDRWLPAKRSGEEAYAEMPLTLGYYTRADIPFYYALADAFTVCDQHFCSTLTGTTPNRVHLWTGTSRPKQSTDSPACNLNEQIDPDHNVAWPTFPERLEEAGVSWKVYQNEVWAPGMGDAERWLSNFGDNPLEYFTQYGVKFAPAYRLHRERRAAELPDEIAAFEKRLTADPQSEALQKELDERRKELQQIEADRLRFSPENFAKLPERQRNIHAKAFCANTDDPDYRTVEPLRYDDGGVERTIDLPKGDLFHQFRRDVDEGKLPTVSWLVAPEAFSDHPCSAWFGAWYVAEAINILTKNPEVWKKTIFLLTYDENDGYFDHMPPFCAPDPAKPQTGLATPGADPTLEWVRMDEERARKDAVDARESCLGLGYRVPLVIASPWSRGGCVASEVFDHTSSLQFLEKFLNHKTGREIEEPNINPWRRTVCGDLTSTFREFTGESPTLDFPPRNEFVEGIDRAQRKDVPKWHDPLTDAELDAARRDPKQLPRAPRQEPGTRPSAPLPYELVVDGRVLAAESQFELTLEARKEALGDKSAGAPFIVHARTSARGFEVRNYAVEAGGRLVDSWSLEDFQSVPYDLRILGPNGFFRQFRGADGDPPLEVRVANSRAGSNSGASEGRILIEIANPGDQRVSLTVSDMSYGGAAQSVDLAPGGEGSLAFDTQSSAGWYDLTVRLATSDAFERRYAGRVETGEWSTSDPAIGRVLS